ncbi:MAG: AI-2E family transporter [Melioribacteraceae bacterium]|nr:AI-2E family transporter [Melioribacteraceae bacterium]MCF8264391.1 AI-2E family transporter [Melioribacteraceae bacterium]MCF8413978.1 AI-2E family transporter [Melioribacteraceae bacterium]MCF8432074.1 AI-2E family transporter [Melioribacteraceae bacterium]
MKPDYTKRLFFLFTGMITIIALIYLQSILIPFVFAFILWFLIREVKTYLKKIKFVREKFPSWLLSSIASILLLSALSLTIKLLTDNIQSLSSSLPVYQNTISTITEKINAAFEIDLFAWLKDFSGEFDFAGILSRLFATLTSLFGNAFTVILYLIFLILEESGFSKKIKAIYPHPDEYQNALHLIRKVEKSIGDYITLKTLVSVLTGFLSYIVLLIIGLDAPIFWAFLIFLLNYIPTIGSLIATIFPATFALLQFAEFTPAVLILLIVGSIQLIIGNIVEPKLMGNTLNISSLVVLLALSFWGAIWGVTGMILSVPVTVIIVIICSEFESTRSVAIMLSENGEIKKK